MTRAGISHCTSVSCIVLSLCYVVFAVEIISLLAVILSQSNPRIITGHCVGIVGSSKISGITGRTT